MKTLLHTCCAPCSIKCVEQLRQEDIEPVLFWYNPNIHPFTEYRERRDTLIRYADEIDAELVLRDEYGLRSFLCGVYPAFENRCEYCYHTRLEAAAQYAAQNGYQSFSSTLLISPYQNHELICKIALEMAQKYLVDFLHRDFRLLFREGQAYARNAGLYMQKYCGCIFSEEDRYQKSKK